MDVTLAAEDDQHYQYTLKESLDLILKTSSFVPGVSLQSSDDCLFVAARFDEIKQRFSEMHFVAQATSTVQV